MPGISFACTADHNLDRQKEQIFSTLDSLLHSPSYQREILLSAPSYLLACTRYKEYPLCSFETENFYFCLEGKVYGKSAGALKAELNDLATLLFKDPSDADRRLRKWLISTNGEFVLFISKKDSNEIAILIDALGHLPLYYHEADGMFLLSREMRFITKLLDTVKFDKTTLAQYLLFCYPLGQRSFVQNVLRLAAGSFVKIDLRTGKVVVRTIFELNLEEKEYANRSLNSNVEQLVELLTEECKAAAHSFEGSTNVLGLSGGLDSRIVMLGMRNASVPFFAATRSVNKKAVAPDVDVARDLAKLYQLDWRLFEIQPPKFADGLKLLKMKNGLNYLGMAFILGFLERLREYYGDRVIYWTGDSGLVLRRELPDGRLHSYDDLIDLILRENQILDPHDVSGLLQIDIQTVRGEIRALLESYPEHSLLQKYVHFMMYGRTMNWHYEGMDRNRCYFWMSAPLEFTTVFNYAMNCPDDQKTNYRLYRAILQRLSPESCRVIYAQYGLAPGSFLLPGVLKLYSMYQKMSPGIRSHLKTLLRRKEGAREGSAIADCIKRQMENPRIAEVFSKKYADRLLLRTNGREEKVFVTVTSAVEDLTNSKSCLEEYAERQLS